MRTIPGITFLAPISDTRRELKFFLKNIPMVIFLTPSVNLEIKWNSLREVMLHFVPYLADIWTWKKVLP